MLYTYYIFLKNVGSPISIVADDWKIYNGSSGKFITFELKEITDSVFLKLDLIEDLYNVDSKTGVRNYIVKGGKE